MSKKRDINRLLDYKCIITNRREDNMQGTGIEILQNR